LAAIDELFLSDGVAHGLSDEGAHPLQGRARFKEFVEASVELFRTSTSSLVTKAHFAPYAVW